MRRALFILLALSLPACGIKGPLYLPTEKKPPASTQDETPKMPPTAPLPASALPIQPLSPQPTP